MFTRLYIHIPFCRSKCPYCAFVSRAGHEHEIDAYVELLLVEMQLGWQECKSAHALDSVYFGGGTPSLLSPQQAESILAKAGKLFGFSPDAEITLEANPGTVDRKLLAGFHSAGVNRLSLGIQSFDEQMLKTLGRIHSAQQAHDAFAAARSVGFENMGIDLIHALPGQTPQMWLNDLQQAVELAPEHLSVYGLTVEEGTPFAERYEDESALPDEDISADMFEAADEFLTAAGYEHYEIANYARPGFRASHNSGYWRRDGYLGLGAGAHSFIQCSEYGARFSNTPELDEYAAAIHDGRLPRRDITVLTRDDAMAEFMFLGLRMADGVKFADFKREFGIALQEPFGKQLDEMSLRGLLETDNDRVRLTLRGMLLSNQVFSAFLKDPE